MMKSWARARETKDADVESVRDLDLDEYAVSKLASAVYVDPLSPRFYVKDPLSPEADDDAGSLAVVRPRVGLGPTKATLIVINYMSVGYILVPGAFAAAGTLLAGVILFLVSFQSYVTATFVLEACARAEWLERRLGVNLADSSVRSTTQSKEFTPEAVQGAVPPEAAPEAVQDSILSFHDYLRYIRRRTDDDDSGSIEMYGNGDKKFDFNDSGAISARDHTEIPSIYGNGGINIRIKKFELPLLQRVFLGRGWNLLFTVTAMLDLYGLTWAFCSIFGSALSEELPIPGVDLNYEFYIVVFVLIAIPLSCTAILDQLYVQLTFLGARLLMVLLMIGTLLVAYMNPDKVYFAEQVGPAHNVPLANWRSTIHAIVVCCFATAFQFSVPAVAQVTTDKKVLSRIFQSAVGFMFVSNLILALMTTEYFGTATNDSNNLNWSDYVGSPIVSKYIVLFAAIDGVAVFPLIAISLGGMIMSAVYGEGMREAERDWKKRTLFRFLASVPQAVGALFFRDLGVIAIYTGIFTVISYTIAPAMLCIASYRRMTDLQVATRTAYSTSLISDASHVKLAYLLVFLSILLIVGVIADSFFRVEETSGHH